jgi:UDPglucose 6-dehydrogenase
MNEVFVIGSGYVGLANGLALAKENIVTFIDIDSEKVDMINNQECPIDEKELQECIEQYRENIKSTTNISMIKNDSFVILALPTNYIPEKDFFDTSILENVCRKISELKIKLKIIIKSTIPVGFTRKMREKYGLDIYFSPEFLREGRSLFDARNPDRIIVSPDIKESESVMNLLNSISENNPLKLFMDYEEAESVKLFANTYLAMRVAYFNEIDSYLNKNNMNVKNVIDGIGSDNRIGQGYMNPSFGYGGYCFPKDTKQALATVGKNSKLLKAIVDSNVDRINNVADEIIKISKNKKIGFSRLTMKFGSDNLRESSTLKVLEKVASSVNSEIYLFEPHLKENQFKNVKLVENEIDLYNMVDVVVLNRLENKFDSDNIGLFTKDVYHAD